MPRERSLDTCAVYAPDMWPIIGLKSAVIVVGGSETGKEGRGEGEEEGEEDAEGDASAAVESSSGDGAVG